MAPRNAAWAPFLGFGACLLAAWGGVGFTGNVRGGAGGLWALVEILLERGFSGQVHDPRALPWLLRLGLGRMPGDPVVAWNLVLLLGLAATVLAICLASRGVTRPPVAGLVALVAGMSPPILDGLGQGQIAWFASPLALAAGLAAWEGRLFLAFGAGLSSGYLWPVAGLILASGLLPMFLRAGPVRGRRSWKVGWVAVAALLGAACRITELCVGLSQGWTWAPLWGLGMAALALGLLVLLLEKPRLSWVSWGLTMGVVLLGSGGLRNSARRLPPPRLVEAVRGTSVGAFMSIPVPDPSDAGEDLAWSALLVEMSGRPSAPLMGSDGSLVRDIYADPLPVMALNARSGRPRYALPDDEPTARLAALGVTVVVVDRRRMGIEAMAFLDPLLRTWLAPPQRDLAGDWELYPLLEGRRVPEVAPSVTLVPDDLCPMPPGLLRLTDFQERWGLPRPHTADPALPVAEPTHD